MKTPPSPKQTSNGIRTVALSWWTSATLAGLLLVTAAPASAQVYSVKAGDILAANYRGGGNTVVRVDPQTGATRKLGVFNIPTDLALSPDGYLYVSEWGGAIKRLNLTNGVVKVVNPNSTLSQVWGLALDPAGDLFVSTGAGARLVRIDPATGAETDVAQGGQMALPVGLELLDPSRLVVASLANSQVLSVSLPDATQTVLAQGANGIDQPWGIAVYGPDVFVGAHDSKLLQRISGGSVTPLATLAGYPFGIASDADGNIIVGVSGGLAGPYALERHNPQGILLGSYSGDLIGEVTGLEVSRITVLAENQGNLPPVISAIQELTVDEGSVLSFAASAADPDWPLQKLIFSLQGAVPAGASISPSGLFIWMPSESQGPTTNRFTLVVTDDGVPSLSATQAFTVIVNEVNTPPGPPVVANGSVLLGELLSFKATATDSDLPPQALTLSLAPGAPAGATVAAGGEFSWTPAVAPGDYHIGIVVTDSGNPPLSATNFFTVAVRDTNLPPVIPGIASQAIDEGTQLSFRIDAFDSNLPPQTLTFSFAAPAPQGAALSSAGIFTWIPTESQGPSTNVISFRVTDTGVPPLAATSSFTVVVREVNRPPSIDPIPDQAVNHGELLSFAVTAKDPDLPAQHLAFSLGTNAPAGAVISPEGQFSWTPDINAGSSTVTITVNVADDGQPPLTHARDVLLQVRGGFLVNRGDLLVADYQGNTVWKVDAQTGAGQSLGTFSSPTDVALGTNGILYVAQQGGLIEGLDLLSGSVSAVNPNGTVTDLRSLALGVSGELYVASASDDSIVRIDPATGAETLVTRGDLVSGPFGIGLLGTNHLVVSSFYNDSVVVVALTNNSQHLVAAGNGISQPWGVGVKGEEIYVASYGGSNVQKLAGGAVSDWASTIAPPSGAAIGPDGNLWLAVNGAAPELVQFRADGSVGANYSAAAAGMYMGVEVAAFTVSPPTLTLQWSDTAAGPFVDEAGAVVDPAGKTITAAQRAGACFYRLRAGQPTRILELRVGGGQVILLYQ